MPPPSTLSRIRLNNISACLNTTANTFEIISKSLKTPFSEAISNTTKSAVNFALVCFVNYFGTIIESHSIMIVCQPKQGRVYQIVGADSRVAQCNSCSSYDIGYGWRFFTWCLEAYSEIHRVWKLCAPLWLLLTTIIQNIAQDTYFRWGPTEWKQNQKTFPSGW
jgi:hypothetical protein